MTEKIYDLEELEVLLEGLEVEDLDKGAGLLVRFPVGLDDFAIVPTARVGHFAIGLAYDFTCEVCQKPADQQYYICRGSPGWCYVFTQDGRYMADLREGGYYCDDHEPKLSGKLVVAVILHPDQGDKTLHRPPAGQGKEQLN